MPRIDFWTAEQTQLLREMKLAGYTNFEVAERLDRTRGQVGDHWRWINRTADDKEARNRRNQEYRRSKRGPDDPVRFIRQQTPGFVVPDEILLEREARLSVERTPCEILMGDPPQGFSALQGRNGEAARSYHTPRSRPTLATTPMRFQGED